MAEVETEMAALAAFVKLKRSCERISTYAHTLLADFDLTESQFGVLEAIHHLGPLCQKDLAAKILRTTANMTQTIDKLERRGLVVRKRAPADRRYYSIELTASGRKLIGEVFPLVRGRIVTAMTVLSQDELRELGRMCKVLGTTAR